MALPWMNNPGIDGIDELTTTEEALIASLASLGSAGQVLTVNGTADGIEWATASGSGDVTAASAFGTDNVLIKSDGTGKGVQSTAISVSDLDAVSGVSSLTIDASGSLLFGAVTIISDSTGTTTLSNIDAIDATTETTIESAIDTLPNLTSATSLSITESQISDLQSYLLNVVEDTTPQLGGTLDLNSNNISDSSATAISISKTGAGSLTVQAGAGGLVLGTSSDNTDVTISPHGTGNIVLGNITLDADQTVGAGQDNYVLTYDNATGLVSLEAAAAGSGNTLDQAYDQGGAGSGRSITADSGAVEITVSDTSNNVGLSIIQNDVTNNPNSLYITNAGAGDEIVLENTRATAIGAGLTFYHNSASPGTDDELGNIYFKGKDSAGNVTTYANIHASISTATDGAEDGTIFAEVISGGTNSNAFSFSSAFNRFTFGTGSSAATLTSQGNQDLVLESGNSTTGSITITDGANGNISLTPNGTGNVVAATGPTSLLQANGHIYLANTSGQLRSAAPSFKITDGSGNERIVFTNVASAVNEISVSNAATGNAPQIAASGGDTNIDIQLVPKGSGTLIYPQATATPVNLGNLGATETIDFAAGHEQYGTLDSNVTITHSNEVSGRTVNLYLAYDGTAQRTITWSGVDKWLDGNNGSAPATPSASGEVLVVTLKFIGTTCYASATGNYAVY